MSENKEQNYSEENVCRHGVSRTEPCQGCLIESQAEQPVWSLVADLTAKSKYNRENLNSPETIIEHEGKKYKIELLRSNNEKNIKEVQELLEETFSKEETDPVEYLKSGIDGKNLEGSSDIAIYRIFIAKDEKGKIQSLYGGGLIKMNDAEGNPTGESVFMGAYGITRPTARKQGIIRELYISSMIMAAQDAQESNTKLTTIAGECTYNSELTWNAVGRRRIYVESGENELSELKYLQPALKFDKSTGKKEPDSNEIPEHIMIQFLDGKELKERVSSAIDAIYRWCNEWSPNMFENEKAYKEHKNYIENIKNRFNDFLNNNGKLELLTATERTELLKNGTKIIEHTDADHGTSGQESA